MQTGFWIEFGVVEMLDDNNEYSKIIIQRSSVLNHAGFGFHGQGQCRRGCLGICVDILTV